jgi:TfoX/Sxy family transcriptional regulator of competence genes
MNDWKKVPPELITRFDAALPQAADVQRRQMFGCPCAFVNGNMFAGLHEDRLMVRVPDEAAAHPAVIMGRTMKEYALLADAVGLSAKAMAGWIERGYRYTRGLPPKAVRAAKAAKAPKAAKPTAPRVTSARVMKTVGTAAKKSR